MGIRPVARNNNSRTIWPDEAGLGAAHRLFDFHHVVDRDAFGDADDQIQPGVDPLENRIRGKWRGDENRRHRSARLLHSLTHGVKDRHIVREELTSLAGRDAGHDLGAVVEAELRVPRSKAARDALHKNACFGGDKNGHGQKDNLR